jgi:transposase
LGKKDLPSVIIIDSQAVKNTDCSSAKTKGFCHYKATNGIKRHIAVDTIGLPALIKVTPANKTDDDGLIEMIRENQDYFLVLNHVLTILADNGYHTEKILDEIGKINPALLLKIKIIITPKPTPDPSNPGFKPAHKRWVVERSNAWMEKCHSLQKNREKSLLACELKIKLCFIRVLVRRLGREGS